MSKVKYALSDGRVFEMDVPAFWGHASQKTNRGTARVQDILVDAPVCVATHEYITALQAIIDEQRREIDELVEERADC